MQEINRTMGRQVLVDAENGTGQTRQAWNKMEGMTFKFREALNATEQHSCRRAGQQRHEAITAMTRIIMTDRWLQSQANIAKSLQRDLMKSRVTAELMSA
jgi:hypothetical protein